MTRGHTFYTVVTTLGIGVIAITMVFVLVQNRNISTQGQRNGEAIVSYLECIGNIPRQVATRTQNDYNVCISDMRAIVRGTK